MAAELPPSLAAALAERYDLRDLLGRGGMATVYLARDRKHQRDVALKVLLPELAASLGAERFLKEIETVAQLSHPHILALYDSGEAGGFVYFVMPHIGGGSLRSQLSASGWIDAGRAIEIASSVADALSYAHGVGVLHRDIKPENILFSHGHPIVADFGIAKALSSASSKPLTRTGLSLGTPGYMSPEQAAGYMELDVRTDVFSLGVVVYEMIVGQIPVRWPSEDAVRAGRFVDSPLEHRARLTSAGTTIERALIRALAIQVDQRTQSPAEFIDELRGTATPRRRYGTDEVNAIVKRASEIEASNPTAGAMTLGGVEAIAAEVGIAPAHVRSALQSMNTPGSTTAAAKAGKLGPLLPPKHNHFAGGPGRILHEQVIEGEVAEADFPVIVDEIRRVMGAAGRVTQLGRSFVWAMERNAGAHVEVSLTVRGGSTRISVSENLGTLAFVVFMPMMMIGGFLGSAILMAILAKAHIPIDKRALVTAGWLALNYLGGRLLYGAASRSHGEQARFMTERLATLINDLKTDTKRLPGGST